MLRPLVLSLVCATALASLHATVGESDHPGSVPVLLGLDKVRDDLKLDALQCAVLNSIRAEYKAAARKLVNPLPPTPQARVAAENQLAALSERSNKRALSVLSVPQRKRFLQIEHQVLGASMLYAPRVQKQIGITPAQHQQIVASANRLKASTGKINARFEAGKISFQERLDLLRTRRLASGADLLKLLTPEQRDAFRNLSGEKIAL